MMIGLNHLNQAIVNKDDNNGDTMIIMIVIYRDSNHYGASRNLGITLDDIHYSDN